MKIKIIFALLTLATASMEVFGGESQGSTGLEKSIPAVSEAAGTEADSKSSGAGKIKIIDFHAYEKMALAVVRNEKGLSIWNLSEGTIFQEFHDIQGVSKKYTGNLSSTSDGMFYLVIGPKGPVQVGDSIVAYSSCAYLAKEDPAHYKSINTAFKPIESVKITNDPAIKVPIYYYCYAPPCGIVCSSSLFAQAKDLAFLGVNTTGGNPQPTPVFDVDKYGNFKIRARVLPNTINQRPQVSRNGRYVGCSGGRDEGDVYDRFGLEYPVNRSDSYLPIANDGKKICRTFFTGSSDEISRKLKGLEPMTASRNWSIFRDPQGDGLFLVRSKWVSHEPYTVTEVSLLPKDLSLRRVSPAAEFLPSEFCPVLFSREILPPALLRQKASPSVSMAKYVSPALPSAQLMPPKKEEPVEKLKGYDSMTPFSWSKNSAYRYSDSSCSPAYSLFGKSTEFPLSMKQRAMMGIALPENTEAGSSGISLPKGTNGGAQTAIPNISSPAKKKSYLKHYVTTGVFAAGAGALAVWSYNRKN